MFMNRHLLLLIIAVLFSAASAFAQHNHLLTHEQFSQQMNNIPKPTDFEILNLFTPNTGSPNSNASDWYEQDTVWVFSTDYEDINIYTYNPQGYRLTRLRQRWKDDDWKNEERYTYTYDANNNCIILTVSP
jgi:hypothetical protein